MPDVKGSLITSSKVTFNERDGNKSSMFQSQDEVPKKGDLSDINDSSILNRVTNINNNINGSTDIIYNRIANNNVNKTNANTISRSNTSGLDISKSD